MSEKLKEASVSNDSAYRAKNLAYVSKLASEGAGTLTFLPISHNISSKVVDFFYSAEDFTYACLCETLSSNELTDENLNAIDKLSTTCDALAGDIRAFHENRDDDFVWYDKNYEFIAKEGGRFDEMFKEFMNISKDVTQNNYDGKYSSDVIKQKEENSSDEKTPYEYSDELPSQSILSLDEALLKATDYIMESGFDNMRAVKQNSYSNTAVFSFAYEENGVVFYPDIINIHVSLEDGEILSYDASDYQNNHKIRQIPLARLSIDEAQENLSGRLNVKARREVLKLNMSGKEILCYEYECENNGNNYIVTLDANTASEREIVFVDENSVGKAIF